jgi:hypothetical protein
MPKAKSQSKQQRANVNSGSGITMRAADANRLRRSSDVITEVLGRYSGGTGADTARATKGKQAGTQQT